MNTSLIFSQPDLQHSNKNMDNHFNQNTSPCLETLCFVEEPFFWSNKINPCDFSKDYSQCEFPFEESILEAMPLQWDPLYASLDINPSQGLEDEFKFFEEIGVPQYDSSKQVVLYDDGVRSGSANVEERKENKVNKLRSERKFINSSSSTELTRAEISRYFYMPITQAARELNVGLTLLKKKCRELGIPRWPHRKLMSLQTLIKNVQVMEPQDGEEGELKIENAIKRLEEQLKLIEEMPDVELEDKTKKLRQACFKANYKKRRHMKMLELPGSPTSNHLSLETVESSASATIKRMRMQIEEM